MGGELRTVAFRIARVVERVESGPLCLCEKRKLSKDKLKLKRNAIRDDDCTIGNSLSQRSRCGSVIWQQDF